MNLPLLPTNLDFLFVQRVEPSGIVRKEPARKDAISCQFFYLPPSNASILLLIRTPRFSSATSRLTSLGFAEPWLSLDLELFSEIEVSPFLLSLSPFLLLSSDCYFKSILSAAGPVQTWVAAHGGLGEF